MNQTASTKDLTNFCKISLAALADLKNLLFSLSKNQNRRDRGQYRKV